MGNNIRCHLLSTSYILGVRGFFVVVFFGVCVFLHTAVFIFTKLDCHLLY